MSFKRLPIIFIGLLVVTALMACSAGSGDETAAPTAGGPTPLPPITNTSLVVSAEGYLFPARDVQLAFEVGGPVVDVLVEEGQSVSAGQPLVKLSDTDTQAALSVAQAALKQAQANLAGVQAGPTDETIAVAQAAVTRAEVNLAQATAGPTDEAIAVAQARVDTLQAQLAQVQVGPQAETLQSTLSQVKQAENALKLAQAEYDKIAFAADSDAAQPIVLALEDATLRYEAAKANYQALANGATPQEVAVMQAQLAEGQAALNQLLAGATAEQIALAQTGVLEAEAALNQVLAGAIDEQIAVAAAGVEQAKAALAQAQLSLDKLTLSAPFAGTITALSTEVGELVSPGVSVATLADFSGWQIKTDDLTEIDVVKIQTGQPATVQFDALPGESFDGVVSQINQQAELKAGDVTYTIVVTLNQADPRLRWGMTAFVEIETE